MSPLAPPVQKVAFGLSSTDPIGLADNIVSFVQTLDKFNAVMDKIAAVTIALCPASLSMLIRCLDSSLRASSMVYPLFYFQGLVIVLHWLCNLIYGSQIIVKQAHLDDSIRDLLSKMDEVYTFLTTVGLKDIQPMKPIVERITRQTLECSYFIQAYCGNQKFRKV